MTPAEKTMAKISNGIKMIIGIVAIVTVFKLTFDNVDDIV